MKLQITRTKLWIVLIALVLLSGMVGQPVALAGEPSKDIIERAMLSTVKIWILDPAVEIMGTCSGTVIDPAGYILTNFHCVGYTDLYGEDDSGLGLSNGDLFNPDGLVAIGPTLNSKQAPKPTYFAQVMSGDPSLDIAVVKITAMVNKDEKLPKTLSLVTSKRADSDQYKVGDFIATVGYPGVGGPLVTYLPGQISGFEDENGDGVLDAFKTSANISAGNSGGLGMNERGEQIGVSTYSAISGADKISRFKMVNIAEPLIQEALKKGGVKGGDNPGDGGKTNPPTAKPTNPTSGFSKLQFGTDQKNGQLVNAGTKFPAGTKTLAATFEYGSMKTGVDWGYQWFINDKVVAGKSTGKTWTSAGNGVFALSLDNSGDAMPEGTYKLCVFLSGKVALEGGFTVGQVSIGKTPPKATPPSNQNTGVVIMGQIVDADTQRGIPGALIVILKPGVTVAQFAQGLQAGNYEDLVAALGAGDQGGNYQTVPGLAPGKTYSVVLIADGYSARAFENALEVKSDDSGAIKMKPLTMQKR